MKFVIGLWHYSARDVDSYWWSQEDIANDLDEKEKILGTTGSCIVVSTHSKYVEGGAQKELHLKKKLVRLIWVFPKNNGTPKSSILIGLEPL